MFTPKEAADRPTVIARHPDHRRADVQGNTAAAYDRRHEVVNRLGRPEGFTNKPFASLSALVPKG